MQPTFLRRLALPAAIGFGLLLTYLLVVPSPFWMFGDDGVATEQVVDRSVSGFVQHLIAYAVFTALLLMAIGGRRRWILSPLVAATHCVLTEFVQAFVPMRHADWYDVVANGIGIGLGMMTVFTLSRIGRIRPARQVVAVDHHIH